MSNNLLLIAAREFRQIAATRSFWLTLLIMPLFMAGGPIASKLMKQDRAQSVMIIDQSGGETGKQVARRISLNEQRIIMIELVRHIDRRNISLPKSAAWAQKGRRQDDQAVEQFVAAGGQQAALAAIRAVSPTAAQAFDLPEPGYRLVKTPPSLIAQTPQSLSQALEPYLRPADTAKQKPVDYIMLIPRDFGASPAVGLWVNGQPRASFLTLVQGELAGSLRAHYLTGNGVSPDIAKRVDALFPAIAVTTPPAGTGRDRVLIRSIVPVISAFVLLMALLLSGNWMLQTTVEERSNKLLETVLACASPNELMYGKLCGTVALGLTMVTTWVACALFAAYATQGDMAALIRPALEPVSTPANIVTIIYFFITGYVSISMIFLVLGVMSDSMQEAQGFLTPVLFLIMIPLTLLAPAILDGGTSIGLSVMTWVPLYTPFTILARLGGGIPAWEVIGSGLLLLAFVTAELVLLGRVFRACLLNSGRRPSLKAIFQMMRAPN